MKGYWDNTVDPMAKVGMRVRLIQMVDDPNPIDDKLEGTIYNIDSLGTLHVNWDDGRNLGIIPEVDNYELLPPSDEQIDIEDMIENFATDKSKINKSMPKPTVRNSKLAKKFRSELKKTKVKDIKVEGDLEETSTAGGVSTGHFEGPLGGKDETIIKKPFAKQIGKELTGKKSISNPIGKIYTVLPKTESKIFKFKNIVNEKFVSKAQQRYLYANEPDVADEFDSTMTSKDYKELPEKVKKKKETKEEVDETTTHASVWGANGPPVVPIFGAKGNDHIPSRKPIWKGGKIVQKIKNDGVLTESKLFHEINKVKWVKGGKFVKIKDKCAKYNNQPWCSQGAIDNPLELSDTTFENVEKISKKIDMKEDLIIDTIMSKINEVTSEKNNYSKRPQILMW